MRNLYKMQMKRHIFIYFYTSCIIIKILLIEFCIGQTISYSALEFQNASCFPADTCSISINLTEDNLLDRNCQCKASCLRFNTCCIDALHQIFKSQLNISNSSQEIDEQLECHELRETGLKVYARTKCHYKWQGNPTIKNFCENDLPTLEDPLALLPVTNYVTATTYKNYFCALCNDDIQNLEFWNISIEQKLGGWSRVPSLAKYSSEELLQNLVYDNDSNRWGVYRNSNLSSNATNGNTTVSSAPQESLIFVTIRFQPPEALKEELTQCDPNLISDCDPNWSNETVKSMCHSYMGMVYLSSNASGSTKTQRYKNIHCAICNFNYGIIQCKPENTYNTGFSRWRPHGGYGTRKPYLSFALFLDINTSKGTSVGVSSRCREPEVYDPFFKKCRSMVCVKPGYKIRDGKCQPP